MKLWRFQFECPWTAPDFKSKEIRSAVKNWKTVKLIIIFAPLRLYGNRQESSTHKLRNAPIRSISSALPDSHTSTQTVAPEVYIYSPFGVSHAPVNLLSCTSWTHTHRRTNKKGCYTLAVQSPSSCTPTKVKCWVLKCFIFLDLWSINILTTSLFMNGQKYPSHSTKWQVWCLFPGQ